MYGSVQQAVWRQFGWHQNFWRDRFKGAFHCTHYYAVLCDIQRKWCQRLAPRTVLGFVERMVREGWWASIKGTTEVELGSCDRELIDYFYWLSAKSTQDSIWDSKKKPDKGKARGAWQTTEGVTAWRNHSNRREANTSWIPGRAAGWN